MELESEIDEIEYDETHYSFEVASQSQAALRIVAMEILEAEGVRMSIKAAPAPQRDGRFWVWTFCEYPADFTQFWQLVIETELRWIGMPNLFSSQTSS